MYRLCLRIDTAVPPILMMLCSFDKMVERSMTLCSFEKRLNYTRSSPLTLTLTIASTTWGFCWKFYVLRSLCGLSAMLSRLGQAVNATKKKRVCFVDFSACSRGNKPNRQPFTIDKIDRPPSTDDKTDRQFSFSTTGKSTLLRALAVGVYDKVPGDGREFVVADPGAVTVRAEDGRSVSGVDISPFICSLPTSATAGAAAVAAAVGVLHPAETALPACKPAVPPARLAAHPP